MNIKKKLDKYLDEYLNIERHSLFLSAKMSMPLEDCECVGSSTDINNYISNNKEEDTFQTKLFKLIDDRDLKDSDVYNKAYIDRRLFSKIRNDKNYHPSKETIILLGLSLELNESEIVELLESASYSLPMNTTFDLIIRFCFKEGIYDINTVNEFLYDHECKTLN